LDTNSGHMKCLFQLMSISIISLPIKEEDSNNNRVIIKHDTKLEHLKMPFKIRTGLNFENEGGCSNLRTWSKILEEEGGQGSSQGTSEGVHIEEHTF